MNHTLQIKAVFHILSAIICLGIASCSPAKEEKATDEQAALPNNKTIQLVAQQRPGAAPASFDMPVEKGLDKLEFAEPDEIELSPTDLVLGIFAAEQEIAIPLYFMEGFEVANFSMADKDYLITWCPLVGSARAFDNESTGFDFGMGLVENNLLMVDRKTQSVWNQLSQKAIHGDRAGEQLTPVPGMQSTWAFWKARYPDTKVLINKDTSDAVFPSVLFENPHYTNWSPDSGRYITTHTHKIDNVGMGISKGNNSVYFPFEILFENISPLPYALGDQQIFIHFDQTGLTAWAEDEFGKLLPSTITYSWAWQKFYPESIEFGG